MSTRVNLATNPTPATSTNWALVAGTGGAATVPTGTVPGYFRVSWTAATTAPSGGLSYTQMGLSAAVQYAHQVWVLSSRAQTMQLLATYLNSSGATVNTVTGATVTVPANTWTQLTVSGLSGAAVTGVRLSAQVASSGVNWAAGDTLDGRNACIETGLVVGTYFDGSTPSAAWNGTANASTSTLYIPELLLTAYTDANPSPRVLVTAKDFPPSVQRATIQRTAEGRTMRVRGGVNVYAVGGTYAMDNEAPFGIPLSYQAEQFDANGLSLGLTAASTTQLDVTDTWVHQPLSPALAVKARLRLDSANDLVRSTPGDVVWTEGATVGRLIGGQRVGLRGASVRLRMGSAADADVFSSMFGSYSTNYPAVLCIRTPPHIRLPAVLFAGCLDPHEVSAGLYAMITFDMIIDEVAPPAPGLVLPALRRKDIDAAFPTRAARAAAYATRLERDTDYTKAGLGG